MAVHEQAKSFGKVADSYARGRPEYPAEVIEWVRHETGTSPGDQVVDVGAGTGKFTKLLLDAGYAVTAVEPIEGMRARLSASLPQVRALGDAAEHLSLEDETADLVTCAQSFHWFANASSISEFARVLRPQRFLLLVWNQRDASDPVQAMLDGVLESHQDPEVPHSPSRAWKPVIDGSTEFVLAAEAHFQNVHELPRDAVADRLRSMSIFSNLAQAEQQSLLAELDALVPRTEMVRLPYRNEAYLYRKTT